MIVYFMGKWSEIKSNSISFFIEFSESGDYLYNIINNQKAKENEQ